MMIMNCKSFITFFTAILTSLSCLAQSTPTTVTEYFRPASTNQQGKPYPQVNSERMVRARFPAPDAQKVQLDIGGKKYDMVKDEKGVWTGESLPQDEGFHYYQLRAKPKRYP
jgi:hypothetical protein